MGTVRLKEERKMVEYQSVLQFLTLLFIAAFTVWGLAGLMLSLRNKRSTVRAWWWGSRYETGDAQT